MAFLQLLENLQVPQSADSGSCRNCDPKQFGKFFLAFRAVLRRATVSKTSVASVDSPTSLGLVAASNDGISGLAGVGIVEAGCQETDVVTLAGSSDQNLSKPSNASNSSNLARASASGSHSARPRPSRKSAGKRLFCSSSVSSLSSSPMICS